MKQRHGGWSDQRMCHASSTLAVIRIPMSLSRSGPSITTLGNVMSNILAVSASKVDTRKMTVDSISCTLGRYRQSQRTRDHSLLSQRLIRVLEVNGRDWRIELQRSNVWEEGCSHGVVVCCVVTTWIPNAPRRA